jgi:hypothetical protein
VGSGPSSSELAPCRLAWCGKRDTYPVAALRDIATDETMSRIGELDAIDASRPLCLVVLRRCIIYFRTSALRSDQVEIPYQAGSPS